MKRLSRAVVIACMALSPALQGQSPWSTSTAYVLSPGRVEAGIFQPVRFGHARGVEVTVSLLGAPGPGLAVKKSHGDLGKWRLATRHAVGYPTALLRLVAREGIGGVIPADSKVPFLVSFRNDLIGTLPLSSRRWLTIQAGAAFALRSGARSMPTIDLPLVYPRTDILHGGVAFETRARLDGILFRKLVLGGDVGLWVLPRSGEVHFERCMMITWASSSRLQPFLGYRTAWGRYPFGTQRHFIPFVSLRWVVRPGNGAERVH